MTVAIPDDPAVASIPGGGPDESPELFVKPKKYIYEVGTAFAFDKPLTMTDNSSGGPRLLQAEWPRAEVCRIRGDGEKVMMRT